MYFHKYAKTGVYLLHSEPLFHCTGELVNSLPDKKMFGTNKQEFIDGKREEFEEYLQVSNSCTI